jgi:hypothetical protein
MRFDFPLDIDGENSAILLYADDVVLMAENTEDIQKLINVLDIWCNNNCLIKSGPLRFSQFSGC